MQRVAITIFILILAGCSSSGAPTHYFLMNPVTDSEVMSTSSLYISVGPTEVPEYLQRKAIASRVGTYQLALSSTHKWASPLQDQLALLLRLSLQARLPNATLTNFPEKLPSKQKSDLQVMLEILRFDGELGGQVELAAAWRLLDFRAKPATRSGTFRREIATSGDSYAELVSAHNQLFDQLSDQLAEEIVGLIE